jgi:hypothetical protein
MCRAGPRCRGGKYRGPASPGQPPYRTPSQPGSPVLNVLRQMLRCVRAQYRPRIQSRLHRGQDSDSGMLWQRGRDPGRRVHHQAIGLSAAVDLEDGAAHINPSGPSRGGRSTSPQPSISAAMCARPCMGADYATRREPSHLREPIAHHVSIREAVPEALSILSLPILAHPMPTGVPSPGQRGKS